MEPSTAPPESNNVEPASVEPGVLVISEDDLNEGDESQVAEELIDDEKDRRYEDELVGRTVKVLYENGWFLGEIKYFIDKISLYCVHYKGKSTDLINISDIDGAQIVSM